MRYENDKSSSKLVFLTVAILIVYLAFFQFDIVKAYNYTVESCIMFFQTFS